MPVSSGKSSVSKPEKLIILSTDASSHFTAALVMNADTRATLPGLKSNNITIKGVNAQSIQKLKYRLIFWGSKSFSSGNLNVDSFTSDVILDFTDQLSAFQIGASGQYYLNISGLDVPVFTDGLTLYCSLQNLSPISKLAGASGAVQIDIKYGLRL